MRAASRLRVALALALLAAATAGCVGIEDEAREPAPPAMVEERCFPVAQAAEAHHAYRGEPGANWTRGLLATHGWNASLAPEIPGRGAVRATFPLNETVHLHLVVYQSGEFVHLGFRANNSRTGSHGEAEALLAPYVTALTHHLEARYGEPVMGGYVGGGEVCEEA